MEIAFYACHSCGKVAEQDQLCKSIVCTKCGSKKFHPVCLSAIRLWVFVLTHPSYLIKALREI
jgi:DNA-directed RNA polymerase subunit RPC12/RpoP